MTTAFVLSGGGSLGAVQVGMLQALAQRGIEPDLLIGTSAGAVNAVWVAQHGMSADSLDQLQEVWQRLRRRDIFPISTRRVLAALTGRTSSVTSSEPLGELVRLHSLVDDLADTRIPVHALATDLLSGRGVVISTGSPSDAVRASAAIPGVFPPVQLAGRWLIDGALAAPEGLSHAVRLGATRIYVLPAGVPCALTEVPHSALGVALHAISLLMQERLIGDVSDPPPGASIHLIPPLCPMAVSVADFNHGAELIERAREASGKWLDEGGTELPDPARFLSLHDHHRPH